MLAGAPTCLFDIRSIWAPKDTDSLYIHRGISSWTFLSHKIDHVVWQSLTAYHIPTLCVEQANDGHWFSSLLTTQNNFHRVKRDCIIGWSIVLSTRRTYFCKLSLLSLTCKFDVVENECIWNCRWNQRRCQAKNDVDEEGGSLHHQFANDGCTMLKTIAWKCWGRVSLFLYATQTNLWKLEHVVLLYLLSSVLLPLLRMQIKGYTSNTSDCLVLPFSPTNICSIQLLSRNTHVHAPM